MFRNYEGIGEIFTMGHFSSLSLKRISSAGKFMNNCFFGSLIFQEAIQPKVPGCCTNVMRSIILPENCETECDMTEGNRVI
jgi:hypothetical protein